MSNLVQSIECMVEASVKGLMGMAEGYLSPGSSPAPAPGTEDGHEDETNDKSSDMDTTIEAISIPPPRHPQPLISSSSTVSDPQQNLSHPPSQAPPTHLSVAAGGASKLALPKQEQLVQILDVPSGWIHLQSTYLDGDIGQKRVRSFGLRNVVETEVELEVENDLAGQLVFWLGDDEKSISSSASSTSSSSTSAGSPSLHLTLSPLSTSTIFFAFQPTHSLPSTPAPVSPYEDGGFTPRVKPVLSRTQSSEGAFGVSSDGRSSEVSSFSASSNQSVLGSVGGKSYNLGQSRRSEPVNRSFSVHGSIIIRAVASSSPSSSGDNLPVPDISPAATPAHQIFNLPFFATVCRSLFTAAPIDPVQGLVVGSQVSSGELLIDFGGNSVVGNRYYRDILLVNRSEIELIWKTTIVSSPFKDSVWFELRDLDSENVFGVDHSSQPVPLPSLSSRHLRLELRAKAPAQEFDFTFLISNANQSGNVVTCRAIGSALAGAADESLVLLSGNNLDFGQIVDGVWARQMITCKNNGDKPIDVRFSATKGYDVVFRLAGVAGEDMDEDLSMHMERERERQRQRQRQISAGKGDKKGSESGLSRTSTRDGRASQSQSQGALRDPRAESPMSGGPSAFTSRPSSMYSSEMSNAVSVPNDFGRPGHGGAANTNANVNVDVEVDSASVSAHSDKASSHEKERERDSSRPPSRALSRVTSRNSSHLLHTGDETGSESEDNEPPFFSGGAEPQSPTDGLGRQKAILDSGTSSGITSPVSQVQGEQIPDQIEEVTMRPGTEYRIFVLHRPEVDMTSPPEVAGSLRQSTFKVDLEWTPSRSRSTSSTPTKRTINCSVESCTSLIRLPGGRTLDFGQVTVGASRSLTLGIENLSALSAKVEIAAISKVISANRNVIVIPPFETVEEKLEFFPRRINERYEKQMFVRNLLNRKGDQLVNIKSKNVDVHNLTLHSHLYRILTPSGSNFLDFGLVVINAPSIRTMHIENLSSARLVLELSASQTEDIELYVKAEDEPICTDSRYRLTQGGKYPNADAGLERITSPPNGVGELKERFMETLQQSSGKSGKKVREKSAGKKKETQEDTGSAGMGGAAGKTVAQQVAVALKKGGRGRPVQLYGNAVVFKDRTLLEPHEYLDLACGPPVCAHRSPRSKRFTLLDAIEQEDKAKLSGRHDKIPKLDFAAEAKATGLTGKEGKKKKHPHPHAHGHAHAPNQGTQSHVPSEIPSPAQAPSGSDSAVTSPKATTVPATQQPSPLPSLLPLTPSSKTASGGPGHGMHLNLATLASEVMQRIIPETGGRKSPALTAKRPAGPKPSVDPSSIVSTADLSKLTIDDLLLTIEAHESKKSSITHSSLEEEEAFVRRTIALRKELGNVIASGKLIPARNVCVESNKTRAVVVIMTPNGSIRPHISTRAKRADSRIFIKLVDFDRSLLSSSSSTAAVSAVPAVPTASREDQALSSNVGTETAGENGLNVTSTHTATEPSSSKPVVTPGCDSDLPIRDLIIRSSCVRSVLEVQQSSINFGVCDKGEVKEKTIVVHNKSDTIGLFRLRTSGSIASGDLKLGLGRYGVISAFGRKEVPNFSFTPTLTGNYQESITVENVLDSWNDQAVAVKAMVRKVPTFKVEPAALDFGVVETASAVASDHHKTDDTAGADTSQAEKKSKDKGKDQSKPKSKTSSWPAAQSFVLTNVSKHDRTFVVTVTLAPPAASSSHLEPFARLSLTRDEKDAGTALSKTEEEELEGLLQKLKIARRKGKAEKVMKYEARLAELGVLGESEPEPEVAAEGDPDVDTTNAPTDGAAVTKGVTGDESQGKEGKSDQEEQSGAAIIPSPRPITPGSVAPKQEAEPQVDEKPKLSTTTTTTLSLTLAPNQKTKILVELVAATATAAVPLHSNSVGEMTRGGDVKAIISVHDKRNTDETVNVAVTAIRASEDTTNGQHKEDKMDDKAGSTTTDPLHLALMRHCLDLTLNCEVSPTAFCVGSTLFLPLSSSHYPALSKTGKFVSFPSAIGGPKWSTGSALPESEPTTTDESSALEEPVQGLILGDGWSRQIPGNTHAEANALTNFRSKWAEVQAAVGGWGGANAEANDVLGHQGNGSESSPVPVPVPAPAPLPTIEQVLKDAECFATMEPCSIRTSGGPSCALELVRAGVRAVYLGVEEPPDFVQCEGVRILEDGGVRVIRTSGLEEDCLKAARRGRN